MISTYKDTEDRVLAYLESRVVGQSGFDKLEGEYLYIADLWIHPSHQNDWSIFRDLMSDALIKARSVKWIYFTRKKYGDRMSKSYTKERILKLINKVPSMIVRELV